MTPIAAHRNTLGRCCWQFSATDAVIAPRFEKVVAVNDQLAAFGGIPLGVECDYTNATRALTESVTVSEA